MTTRMLVTCSLLATTVVAVSAADEARGTFTVAGKTTTFKHVYATMDKDAEDASRKYLVLLVSDRPLAPADRVPARLAEAAKADKVRAVKFIWVVGTDTIWTVAYHMSVGDSGQRIARHSVLDLQRFDEDKKVVQAKVESKMLGQNWHYNITLKADIQDGGVADLEPEPTPEVEAVPPAGTPAPPGGGDPRATKMALGKLGYEFKPEALVHAVNDGNLEAVKLFLQLGQSPNVKSGDNHLMNLAVMWCGRPPAENRTAIIQALIDAKGDVKAKDINNSTPLLWAVQTCDLPVIEALVKAGSDVNAQAKGGATPLMMARVLSKPDIAKVLEKAGAKCNVPGCD